MKAFKFIDSGYGGTLTPQQNKAWDIDKVSTILTMVNYIIIGLGMLLTKAKGLVTHIKEAYIESQKSKLENTLMEIGNLVIHRYMLSQVKKLGLGKDWLKMVYDKEEASVWLKNLQGAYVVINQRMFTTIGLADYDDILGKTDKEIIQDSDISSDTVKLLGIIGKEPVVETLGVTEVIDHDLGLVMSHYTIRNKKGEAIAVFGMVTKVGDSRVEAKLVRDLLKTLNG